MTFCRPAPISWRRSPTRCSRRGATAVGLDCVEQALAKVRRVTFYPSGSDDLNFVRLSPKQARLIVERARRSRDPVVLTAGRKVLTSS